MLDLITIGDIKLDTFVVLNDASLQCELKQQECLLCMEYGKKIVVDVVDSQIAGTAPNVAVGIARMGKTTAIISNMGFDGTRKLALERLKKEKVSTRFIRTIQKAQSAYSVVLNYKGEKTILTGHIKQAYRLPKPMPKSRWLYIGEMGEGYETLFRSVLVLKKQSGANIGMNPGTIQIKEQRPALFQLLKHVEILFVNREEAQVLCRQPEADIRSLIAQLKAFGPKQIVITDGKNGAYGFDGAEMLHASIFPGKLVEATGAGDAFATGFIGACMQGDELATALNWGSINASSVIGFVGPQAGLLSSKEIQKHLKKYSTFKPSSI